MESLESLEILWELNTPCVRFHLQVLMCSDRVSNDARDQRKRIQVLIGEHRIRALQCGVVEDDVGRSIVVYLFIQVV